ncbi:hypothetical protein NGTWS0302_23980 [Mycolicibacterium cyprinidarum]|nr:hypothetical protein NGTWS0302_23980 [Mycolicibacterium sp. NGTWS0302]
MTGVDPVTVVDGALTIRGRDTLTDLARCVLARIRLDRLNGASPARYAKLLAAIYDAMSETRHEDAETAAEQTHSNSQDGDDWMSTTQVALLLGVTTRQVQRQAPKLRAVRVGNTWVFRKAPVLALAEERKRKAHNGQRS